MKSAESTSELHISNVTSTVAGIILHKGENKRHMAFSRHKAFIYRKGATHVHIAWLLRTGLLDKDRKPVRLLS